MQDGVEATGSGNLDARGVALEREGEPGE